MRTFKNIRPHEIKCPVCQKGKFIDIENSHGKNSVMCSKCKRYIILDWDNMEASVGSTIKHVVNN